MADNPDKKKETQKRRNQSKRHNPPGGKQEEGGSRRRPLVMVGILLVAAAVLMCPVGGTFGGAEDGYERARVTKVQEVPPGADDFEEIEKVFQVTLRMLSGRHEGKIFVTPIYHTHNTLFNLQLEAGDTVMVFTEESDDGIVMVGIDGHYKTGNLVVIAGIFIVSVFVVTGFHGLKSLISLLITLILIFKFMATFIMKGYPPVLLAVLVSAAVTVLTLLIVSGWNRKTAGAIAGTLGGVAAAGLLGYLATVVMKLTGYTGHESVYLQSAFGNLDLRGILVCGVIIGALGAVMDVSISIASALEEIQAANRRYGVSQLFKSGLKIGKDIIGTMTNTLVLAYVGGSLSLILLLISQRSDMSLNRIVNMDFMCAEIVRSIAGSFGMVLAIPVTAFVTALLYNRGNNDQ